MGMFQVKVTVANPGDQARQFTDQFWVDTGALYTFVPEDRLHAIGRSRGSHGSLCWRTGGWSARRA